MDRRDSVERKQDTPATTIWVRIGLWSSLILMLRSLILLCQLVNGVLVKCLIYFMQRHLLSGGNSTLIYKSASRIRERSLTPLVELGFLTGEWMRTYSKKDTQTYHKGRLLIWFNGRRSK